jgi:septum formation protein
MVIPLILASGSDIRAQLLRNAGIPFDVQIARVDEQMIKESLLAEGASPRDIADALAESKARKVATKHHDAMVIGCDQVLDFQGQLLSKPDSPETAITQIKSMRGERHSLLSAAVIYHEGKPIWRHVGQVRLRMRQASDDYITDYVTRNWDSIRHSVGGYKLEEEGVRLFHSIEGDYFNVLGMPLLELLAFLTLRGVIDS